MPSTPTTCHKRQTRSLIASSSTSLALLSLETPLTTTTSSSSQPGSLSSQQTQSHAQPFFLSKLLHLPSPIILLLISSICCFSLPLQVESSILAALNLAVPDAKQDAYASTIPNVNVNLKANTNDTTSTLRKPALTMPEANSKTRFSAKTMEVEPTPISLPVIPEPVSVSTVKEEPKKPSTAQKQIPTMVAAPVAPKLPAADSVPKPAIGVNAGINEPPATHAVLAPGGASAHSHFISQINLQTFAGSIGGIFAPSISPGGASGLEFSVHNQIFPDFTAAFLNSCTLQFEECSKAAGILKGPPVKNAHSQVDGGASFSVGDCNIQKTQCDQAQSSVPFTSFKFVDMGVDPLDGDWELLCMDD